MLKRILSSALVFALLLTATVFCVSAEETAVPSFIAEDGLYAHAVTGSDTEAWTLWQNAETEDGEIIGKLNGKYLFLPSGSEEGKVEIYNAFDSDVKIDNYTISAKSSVVFNYINKKEYSVTVGARPYTLTIMRSTAEAAIFVNNTDADGEGTDLYSFISASKENSAKAAGAIVNADGTVDNTAVKKIKGRGNTTWQKKKKPFNLTYNSAVSIGGMAKGKKFSLLANYQDGTLARNRILYDLSDAVGMPYASDSRFVDFYINGVYYGSYQCAQKIEVGKSDLINDISDKDYKTSEGALAENFSFCVEVDPSYSADDYHTRASSTELTIKSPEIAEGEPLYNEVKSFVGTKFSELHNALRLRGTTAEVLSEIMDIDSFAKIYLINEFGKNWDSGVSSFYMVYKQSPDGKWRFYASPVWDYDNSLGNAVGLWNELNYMGVNDYVKPTGWWCKYKGKKADDKTSNNLINRVAQNTAIVARASQIWIEQFMPLLRGFAYSDKDSGSFYSASHYYTLLEGTADMNFARGWYLNTSDWIADHSSLYKAYYSGRSYKAETLLTFYGSDYAGEYNYMVDWMMSRAAWLTNEYYKTYVPTKGDVNGDKKLDINDATLIQLKLANVDVIDYNEDAADFNKDGKTDIDDATAIQLWLLS